jgi:delta 1-pyrroline-5-carboxylate dehydrogenase
MPQRTATRRSEGWRGSHPTHRQWDLFEVNLPDSVVSAPAWPELPVEARAALTGLMVELMLQHAAKSLTPTEREAGRDV